MDEKPTSRELSLEMIGKTRRISKLTPSAAPSVVARGFRDSYRSDGLRLFPETSVPVYDNAFHGPYLTGTRATPVGDAQRATSGLPHRRCGRCCRPRLSPSRIRPVRSGARCAFHVGMGPSGVRIEPRGLPGVPCNSLIPLARRTGSPHAKHQPVRSQKRMSMNIAVPDTMNRMA